MKPALTEEALLELVSEQIETEAGDEGIGAYEFHGFRGVDRRPYCCVITERVTVDVTDYAHAEDDLPEYVTGTATGPDEQDAPYALTLASVRTTEAGRAIAHYLVTER